LWVIVVTYLEKYGRTQLPKDCRVGVVGRLVQVLWVVATAHLEKFEQKQVSESPGSRIGVLGVPGSEVEAVAAMGEILSALHVSVAWAATQAKMIEQRHIAQMIAAGGQAVWS
jgi:hypothetical protein